MGQSGVFIFTNDKNGKSYVGGGRDVKAAIRVFKSELRRGKRKTELARDYVLLSEKDLKDSIVEIPCSVLDLEERVEHWINKMDSIDNGYNRRKTYARCDKQLHYKREWYKIKGNSIPDIC